MQKTTFFYEIIIHDDASTDGTREVLEDYQRRYPEKIRLLLEDENQYSKGKSIFELLPQARGEYIALSEGDDEWTYGRKLQEQYDLMCRNSDISLCMHNAIRYHVQTGEQVEQIKNIRSKRLDDEEIILEPQGRAPTTSFFFRSKYLSGIPKWFYNAPVGDDPLRYYYACRGNLFYINKTWAVRNYMHEQSWNYKMQDASFQMNYIKRYLAFLAAFNTYSEQRFEPYLEEKVRYLCSQAVRLCMSPNLTQTSLKEIMDQFREDTGNQFDVTLKRIYDAFRSQCIDDLDTEIEEFIAGCGKKKGRFYLYGTGREAERYAEKLNYRKTAFAGFIVSDGHKTEDVFMRQKVYSLSETDREESYICLTLNEKNTKEVLPYMKSLGYRHVLYRTFGGQASWKNGFE